MFYGGDKEAEKVYTFKKPFKPREIVHENTRFKKGRFRIKNVKYAFNNSDLIRDPRTKTDLKLFRNLIRSIPKTNCSR